MGLPPSLLQAASNRQQLTVVQAAQPTPPQTPVSTITWKSAAVAPAAAAAVIVPEPQKVTDPRAVVNNIRTNERQYSQVSCHTFSRICVVQSFVQGGRTKKDSKQKQYGEMGLKLDQAEISRSLGPDF